MKKILVSLVSVAAIVTATAGATRAYFTSTVTIPNITIATGTLHIKDSSADWMQTVTFNNIKPGDVFRKWVIIENDGTLDVPTLNVTIANVNDPSNMLGTVQEWTYGRIIGT